MENTQIIPESKLNNSSHFLLHNSSHLSHNTLVISGGGIKGIAFIGSLIACEINIKNIKYLSGSSIGALICTGICFGMSLQEIKNFFIKNDLTKLCPAIFDKNDKTKIISSLISSYSIGDDTCIKEEMKKVFENNYDYKTLTFLELYQKTEKELYICGSNLTTYKPDYFSYKTTPDMLIYDALLITTRIPLLFPPIKLDNNYYIDGYVFDPFPVNCFSKDFLKKNKNKILGVISLPNQKFDLNNIINYCNTIFEAVSYQYMLKSISKYKRNIICVNIKSNLLNLKSTEKELEEMFNIGYQKGLKFKTENQQKQ